MTATDTEPFAKAGCPTLAVTTGLKSPYHKPEDDADLIDYDGLNLICDYIAELTLGWAADKPPLVPSGRLAAKHSERLRPVEIGPTLGIGLSSLRYPGSALKGKNQFEFHAGLSSRLNIKHVSVGLDFLFNYASMATANMNGTVYDLFDGRESDGQKSIILPLSIFWNPVENGAFYIGGGVNYRKLMGVDNSVYNTNLWGVQCSFGFRGGKFGCIKSRPTISVQPCPKSHPNKFGIPSPICYEQRNHLGNCLRLHLDRRHDLLRLAERKEEVKHTCFRK